MSGGSKRATTVGRGLNGHTPAEGVDVLGTAEGAAAGVGAVGVPGREVVWRGAVEEPVIVPGAEPVSPEVSMSRVSRCTTAEVMQ